MNIAFNFYTSNSGGTLDFKKNLFEVLSDFASKNKKYNFFIISDEVTSKKIEDSTLNFITEKPRNNIDKILFYEYRANKLLKSLEADVVVNFGDIPIITNINQVFYFDWPYAVYNDNEVWGRMALKDWWSKKIKLYYFKKNLKKVNHWIAQSQLMKKRLTSSFKIENISVIDVGFLNEVSAYSGGIKEIETDSDYLIYPTMYYPHKNIEVILPLAKIIENNNFDLKIILTISKSDHKLSKKFINKIKSEGLNETVLIKGRLEREKLIGLIRSSKGVFMPTLIESYGLPYIEAQSLGVPIYTSDRDFSRELCKDSAFYFDPLSPQDIFECIKENLHHIDLINDKLAKQKKILEEKITWEESISRIILVATN